MEREDRLQPLGQGGIGKYLDGPPVTEEPVEEGKMLFHFIRNLSRDCGGFGIIELSLIAPQVMILTYYAFGL